MEIKQVSLTELARDTVFLVVSGVFMYIFVYLAITDEVFKFRPDNITVVLGLIIGLAALVFASKMYMREVACKKD